ncbi:hypothetical protein XELAEV_18009239mg [Xenopus laevis]|uniref:Uncharacterized protein n=1 Tax=Xenopus laevis TaxID=8355 RepID=A0A974DS02_XENLA|nr:hypothetical protein XELAEV_18009239mg [Xenopus laevis]
MFGNSINGGKKQGIETMLTKSRINSISTNSSAALYLYISFWYNTCMQYILLLCTFRNCMIKYMKSNTTHYFTLVTF